MTDWGPTGAGGPVASARTDLPIVVVGGYDYSIAMNQNATLTVRELARERTVLYILSEVGGSLLNVARGRGRYVKADRLARIALGGMRPRRVEERLWVAPLRGSVAYSSLAYPEPLRRHAVRVLTRVIRRWLEDRGEQECLLLFYWSEVPELTQTVPFAASAYDCTDDHASAPGRVVPPKRVRELEHRLMDAVDRTWLVSPGLMEQRDDGRRRLEVFPTPIDLETVGQILRAPRDTLPQVNGGGPVVGYAGGLTDRMDWELLDGIAERRPGWTLLLVGDDRGAAPQSLHRRPNVVFTGALPYDRAVGAIARFDVGLIPVRTGVFSRGNSFLKLLDYVAAGKPVVASDVPDTAAVAARDPEVLTIATGLDEWLTALDAAVAAAPSEATERARARLLDERSNARRVAALVAGLEEDRAARAGNA